MNGHFIQTADQNVTVFYTLPDDLEPCVLATTLCCLNKARQKRKLTNNVVDSPVSILGGILVTLNERIFTDRASCMNVTPEWSNFKKLVRTRRQP